MGLLDVPAGVGCRDRPKASRTWASSEPGNRAQKHGVCWRRGFRGAELPPSRCPIAQGDEPMFMPAAGPQRSWGKLCCGVPP